MTECSGDLPEGWKWQQDGDIEFIGLAQSELSEKKMTLKERQEFIKAKIKELDSFFENDTWDLADAKHTDDQRTMKARFLLKWSKNPDGTPRAKARLVVQGFKDPDALDGSLQTSSPTALRTTRLSVLLYSQINNWPLFTADVSTAFLQRK